VTINLTSRSATGFIPFRKADTHFIAIPEDGAYAPFNGVTAFITQITCYDIAPGTAAARFKGALGVSLGEGYRASITLEDGSSRLQRKWVGASRLATTRIPRARVVEGGGEIRFGRHDDIDAFT
jgi:hypothetical protein